MTPNNANNEDDNDTGRFVFFVASIISIAIFLGIYIARLNAEIDEEREKAMERLIRCRNGQQASLILGAKPSLHDHCDKLQDEYVDRFGRAK